MRSPSITLLLPMALTAWPLAAFAGDAVSGHCGHESKVRAHMVFVGYQPATVVSGDADDPFAADHGNTERGDLSLRLKLHCRYLHLEAEPYTVVPYGENRVNLAGIETNFLFPVSDRLRVGLYHHSAHNFSKGNYGIGIELNALAVDATLWQDRVMLLGENVGFRLDVVGRQFATRKASPHVFTASTKLDAGDVGSTGLSVGADLEAVSRNFSGECVTSLVSHEIAPSSWRLGCNGAVRVGRGFLDDFGDNLWVGLFLNYGQNFTRIKAFGRLAASGGLYVEIPFGDDTVYPSAR